jgi:hypothetical protein
MIGLGHITEIAEFTAADLDKIAAAYEQSQLGSGFTDGPYRRVNGEDGVFFILNKHDEVVGLGTAAESVNEKA